MPQLRPHRLLTLATSIILLLSLILIIIHTQMTKQVVTPVRNNYRLSTFSTSPIIYS